MKPIYHGTIEKDLAVIRPFKRFTPGGADIANKIPPRVYATYNPAYAIAHSFPWSSDDGVDILVEDGVVTIVVPSDKQSVLEQEVYIYTLPDETFVFTSEEEMGLTYHSTEVIQPIACRCFQSVTEAMEKVGGKIRLTVDRKKLDEIILKNNVKDWWIPELFIQKTKTILPAELEVLADPPEESKNHNCFAYALGFADKLELVAQTNGFDDLYFIKLLENNELEKTDSPVDGDYVIYQDLKDYPDRLTHIGVFDGDKIVSKWAWGPLVRHSIWDVPASYGNDVFYVKAIPFERSLELYNQYKDQLEPLDPK